MNGFLADRLKDLPTEGAFDFSSKVREFERVTGKKVIRFQIGEPDFPTPDNVKKAGIQAIKDGKTGYTVPEGIPELRQAISLHIEKTRGFKPSPAEVLVAPGGKTLLNNVVSLFAEKSREVVMPSPSYPAYFASTIFFGGKPVFYDAVALDPEELKKRVSSKTSLLVLNSPSNPTGLVANNEFLKTIRDLSIDHGFFVLSDEIYSRIVYGEKFESITKFKEMIPRTILFDGFSKAYSMTGWRLAYAVLDEELARVLKTVGINSYSCPANFVQWAGVEALNGSQDSVRKMVGEYKRRRDFVVKRLNEMPGVECALPQGAFYVFPNFSKALKRKSSKAFQELLLRNYQVAVLAGTDFGVGGEGFIRISYASSMPSLEEGLNRIDKAIQSL